MTTAKLDNDKIFKKLIDDGILIVKTNGEIINSITNHTYTI